MWPDTEGNHATSDEQPLRESGLRPSRLSPFFFFLRPGRAEIFSEDQSKAAQVPKMPGQKLGRWLAAKISAKLAVELGDAAKGLEI